jgi:hypothetical protein
MFIATPEFLAFLRTAKLATYAAQGDGANVRSLLPGSKQLEYSCSPFLYRDSHVGMFNFVGQEVVYLDGHACWSMAYSGGLVTSVPSAEASSIYRALRAALSAVPEALPLRGPATFEYESLSYACATTGGIERFHGRESLSRQGRLVYEAHFSGGVIA